MVKEVYFPDQDQVESPWHHANQANQQGEYINLHEYTGSLHAVYEKATDYYILFDSSKRTLENYLMYQGHCAIFAHINE